MDKVNWLAAWCAVAASSNCNREDVAAWADKCLKSFDERFPVAEAIERGETG